MSTEPMTLYKLMILYMLKQVNSPLTNTQLSDFFLNREYTSYSVLQKAISELNEAALITMVSTHNSSRYELSKEGEETLEFFSKKISPAIIKDIKEYIEENGFQIRNEVGSMANYYKSTYSDFIVHCEVKEGKNLLINLDISVPDEETAEIMANKWSAQSGEIYQFIMKKLMSPD